MSTIETVEQMDNLAPETVVTINHAGGRREQWRRTVEGTWMREGQEGALPIEARMFRGAISAGKVRWSDSTDAEDVDPRRWEVGDWWYYNGNQNQYAYLVCGPLLDSDPSYNMLAVRSNAAEPVRLRPRDLTNPDLYVRYESLDDVPEAFQWFARFMDNLDGRLQPQVPEDLTTALKQYATDQEDDELIAILRENGIDTSVTVDCTVEGSTTLNPTRLSGIVGGGVTVMEPGDEGVTIPWTRQMQVRIKRGCPCDDDWKNWVVDANEVLTQLPGERDEDMEVTLNCPTHG